MATRDPFQHAIDSAWREVRQQQPGNHGTELAKSIRPPDHRSARSPGAPVNRDTGQHGRRRK